MVLIYGKKPNTHSIILIYQQKVFYPVIILILFFNFIIHGIDEYMSINDKIGYNYVYIGYFLFANNLVIFYMSCLSEPGEITQENFSNIQKKYNFMEPIFTIKGVCKTCKLETYILLI